MQIKAVIRYHEFLEFAKRGPVKAIENTIANKAGQTAGKGTGSARQIRFMAIDEYLQNTINTA
jgi:hypothetical protein